MFNKSDISRNTCQLFGAQAKCGYDWWWHSFTAYNEKTGEEKAFFIEYFLCNPSLSTEKPTFGQKNEKPSYFMVKAGTWGIDASQLHRFFSWAETEVSYKKPFYVKSNDCFCTENKMAGSVKVLAEENAIHPEWMSQSGEMSWNIEIEKQVAFNVGYGASFLFRKLQLFEMFWHAEGMKTKYSGEIFWNGEKYLVIPEKSFGYADKNWGKDFTSPWVWLSSCNLTSKITGKKLENSVFDIGGGCPKIAFIALKRKLLSAFFYEGKCFEFNFSKFWTFTRTKFECCETENQIIWHVDQKTWFNRMVTDITCKKNEMLLVNYESPKGEKKHNRLWNGGNGRGTVKLYRFGKLIDEIYAENVGCEYGEYDS